MTKELFLSEVVSEINHIREVATPEEKSKLVLEKLDVSSPYFCIYGLMTGHCLSNRAKEITPKKYTYLTTDSYCDDFSFKTKGIKGFTAMEKFLMISNNQEIENILSYIKNETSELNIGNTL